MDRVKELKPFQENHEIGEHRILADLPCQNRCLKKRSVTGSTRESELPILPIVFQGLHNLWGGWGQCFHHVSEEGTEGLLAPNAILNKLILPKSIVVIFYGDSLCHCL